MQCMRGILMGAAALALAAGTARAAEKKGTIGLSVLTLTNPFFKVIADTMKDEAAKSGYDVLITSGELDPAKQQNQIKDFIVRRVNAIVLCPCDSKAIGPAIKEANEAGIPVFTADIACLAPGVKIVCHIATDNYSGGKLAAVALIEAIGGRGKVAILDHPDVESASLRTKGFAEVIAAANEKPDVHIEIVKKLPGGGARDRSYKVMQDILQAHPDLAAAFCVNDPSALGACAALEEAGKLKQVKIIGFDGMPEGKKAILDGRIYADPIQFPDQIGRKTVEAILMYFRGDDVPAQILIPTALYKKADAEKDPELK